MKKQNRPYGHYPSFELRAIKKALKKLPLLNTEEEDKRLVEVCKEIDHRKELNYV